MWFKSDQFIIPLSHISGKCKPCKRASLYLVCLFILIDSLIHYSTEEKTNALIQETRKLMRCLRFKETMWIIRTEHKRRFGPFFFLPFQTMSRSFCFHCPWSLKLSGCIKRSGSALPAGDWLRTLNPLVGKTSFSSRTVNLGSAQILLRSHICLSNYHTPSGKERDIALNHWCLHYSVYILIRHTKLFDF